MGIVTSHAYTLIGCKEYKGAKLILLRNPVNINFLDIILVGDKRMERQMVRL